MIEHVIVYTCDICGRKHEERYLHQSFATPRYPCIPAAWQEIRSKLICDIHVVQVEVT